MTAGGVGGRYGDRGDEEVARRLQDGLLREQRQQRIGQREQLDEQTG